MFDGSCLVTFTHLHLKMNQRVTEEITVELLQQCCIQYEIP